MNAVYLVGTFPPPLHGMAAVNAAMRERLLEAGFNVVTLNTAPWSLNRSLVARLTRIPRLLRVWCCLFSARWRDKAIVVYLAPAGGWGQIYDLITVSLCRAMRVKCVLHHHNWAYLYRCFRLMRWICRVAGPGSLHVVLCSRMGHALESKYFECRWCTLTNSALFNYEITTDVHSSLKNVGFLSNLTIDKGTDAVISIAYEIKRLKLGIRVIVAGPCHDARLIKQLKMAMNDDVLEWRGAVYGVEKQQFWKDIDAFMFPSLNEAESLVIWESLAAAVPVIAYDRGCTSGQIMKAGVVVPQDEDYIDSALRIISIWQHDDQLYQVVSAMALGRLRDIKKQGKVELSTILSILSDI